MAEEVKVFGLALKRSPFTCRVEIALKMKGVEYEFIEEDLSNKSADLIKYNPVYKKVPVLLHNGKPISESLIILEYIDETFKGPSILPLDPYNRALARFWAKFLDDKLASPMRKAFFGQGEEQEKGIEETKELLKILENQLKGKKFFGGDSIGLVDIAANGMANWLPTIQEVTGKELVTKEKFPHLTKWMDDFVSIDIVKESLPNRDVIVETLRCYDLIRKA